MGIFLENGNFLLLLQGFLFFEKRKSQQRSIFIYLFMYLFGEVLKIGYHLMLQPSWDACHYK